VSARIVSAEEARGLLAPLEPGESWTYQPGMDAEIDPERAKSAWIESAPTGAPDSGGDVVALVYRWDDGRGCLAASAPDLAHTVIALEGERDAALARVARLERVLAVERGDGWQAPSGWRREHPGTEWNHGDAHVWRLTTGRWRWVRPGKSNDTDTALEAMEAADAAEG
jgi:hypothetical protein